MTRQCRQCREPISLNATLCRRCAQHSSQGVHPESIAAYFADMIEERPYLPLREYVLCCSVCGYRKISVSEKICTYCLGRR